MLGFVGHTEKIGEEKLMLRGTDIKANGCVLTTAFEMIFFQLIFIFIDVPKIMYNFSLEKC